LGNKLLSATLLCASILVGALGVQTWRVTLLKTKVVEHERALASYKQTLKEVRASAEKREIAILEDFAREKADYEDMLHIIKKTYDYENVPLPNGILSTIDQLYKLDAAD